SDHGLDGWSATTLVSELALGAGESPPRASYAQFVALERAAERDEAQRSFWSTALMGCEAAMLADVVAESGRTSEVKHRRVALAPSTEAGLKRVARECGLPLRTICLALQFPFLGALGGRRQLVSGVLANGRPEVEGGDEIVGLFLNLLPFPLDLVDESWRALA